MIRDTAIARTVDSTELEWMTRFLQPEPWVAKALCAQVDGDLWFTESGQRPQRQALEMCGRCPSQNDCAIYALRNDIREGVWGGLTEKDRARIRRAEKKAARA